MATNATCGTCRWAEPAVIDTDLVIECRRYPPQLTADGDPDSAEQAWPQMQPNDWCGEHAPSKDAR